MQRRWQGPCTRSVDKLPTRSRSSTLHTHAPPPKNFRRQTVLMLVSDHGIVTAPAPSLSFALVFMGRDGVPDRKEKSPG